MKRRSTLATRTRRLANKPVRRPAKASAPKAVIVPLDPIAQALDRWLTLCVTGKPIPQQVWDELDTACGEMQAHQVRGNGPKSEMVRAWLGYRAAQAAVQRGALRRADTAFHAAYLAWQNWKEHGRHARAKPVATTVHNGHALVTVEAGEEWDADNELWCRLRKAVCQHCAVEGPPARSTKGAIQKFQRQHPFAPCTPAEKSPSRPRKKK